MTPRRACSHIACGLLVLIVAAAAHADSKTFTGKVSRVVDGDTIEVVDVDEHRNRIRLHAIDAPEKGRKKGEEAQPFGEQSRKHLVDLVHDKVVRVDWIKYEGWTESSVESGSRISMSTLSRQGRLRLGLSRIPA